MLNKICQIAIDAGKAIMQVYNDKEHIDVKYKLDESPITKADKVAHRVIVQKIQDLYPEVPIISEENPPSWHDRRNWEKYWLVDPLDGTKEFIKRNGEFTVNIALINKGKPILGVVYAPAFEVIYFAAEGKAWKQKGTNKIQIHAHLNSPPLVVVSRSHHTDIELKEYLHELGKHKIIIIGSSLKFCLIAEGKAQIYPRFGTTNIWDTGAGHAIAIAAGAHVYNWQGKNLDYSPRESFINDGFCVSLPSYKNY
ncbi:3'(2'),5'-bisphosphate nucleotidase CysQ [Pantoea sp. Aalb]|uniref:3'(2'),5'-bisphosphate nucleotidase CysQ n=1 Tax=Pantoea sp. Aalb TaxID=2576762 RepID=UPI00132A9F7E|nr:3'(2'),5'-bisphosphate nucleotidase CysQ [Pantoea sp. Aalb]MXP67687.1 3'(2'),5'-bisphosphate nucleotidase CysQ [Pantoea sp. Aalb]